MKSRWGIIGCGGIARRTIPGFVGGENAELVAVMDTNETFAKEVTAFCETQTFSYGVDDSASVLMKMDNGALCVIESNFNIPDDAVTGKIEIYGTAGSMRADGTPSPVPAEDAIFVQKIVEAAYVTSEEKRFVTV